MSDLSGAGWEVVAVAGSVRDTSAAPKGAGVFYRCVGCGGVLPCHPTDNVGCACGNVFIDIDACRLAVGDLTQFEAVRERSG